MALRLDEWGVDVVWMGRLRAMQDGKLQAMVCLLMIRVQRTFGMREEMESSALVVVPML
jgi:hypothetical protein